VKACLSRPDGRARLPSLAPWGETDKGAAAWHEAAVAKKAGTVCVDCWVAFIALSRRGNESPVYARLSLRHRTNSNVRDQTDVMEMLASACEIVISIWLRTSSSNDSSSRVSISSSSQTSSLTVAKIEVADR